MLSLLRRGWKAQRELREQSEPFFREKFLGGRVRGRLTSGFMLAGAILELATCRGAVCSGTRPFPSQCLKSLTPLVWRRVWRRAGEGFR